MKLSKSFCLVTAVILLFSINKNLTAKTITLNKLQNTIQGWLKLQDKPLNTKLGGKVAHVDVFDGSNGQPLYYVVYLQPSGFIIMPADDEVEPVVAFAPQGTFDPSDKNPLGALVTSDLPTRIAAAKEYQALTDKNIDKKQSTKFTALQKIAEKAQKKWQKLQNLGKKEHKPDKKSLQDDPLTGGLGGTPDDVRVSPLTQSKWSQATECSYACYNYYTPPYNAGDPTNYYSGCVATAMAQLMRYHEYPNTPIGINTYTIYVSDVPQDANTRGGDGLGGAYNWSDMTLDPDCGNYDPISWQAIGALCYDAGVSVNMQYDSDGSGAFMDDARAAIQDLFLYSNAIMGYNLNLDIGSGLNEMINPNLDFGKPVLLGIRQIGGSGHAVIADGYGYNLGTLYHHINMGWAGACDTWYNLPYIDAAPEVIYSSITECLYNIFVSGSGEIISGRIVDNSENPIQGAVVSAQGNGDIFYGTTNSNGIYAIANLDSAVTYMVSVTKQGYDFESQDITTGTSTDYEKTSGNKWPIDFTGTVIEPVPNLNGDDTVDFADFAIFAEQWLRNDCNTCLNCYGADFDTDGDVDYNDMDQIVQQWLQTQQNLTEVQQSFFSIAAEDGRVYDQNNGTGIGYNSTESTSYALRLGDWSALQGFRTVLSFDTNSIPDDANFVSATLQLTCGYEYGTDPFSWGGQCLIDVNMSCLGASTALENHDWQAPANAVAVASFTANPGDENPMLSTPFNANGLSSINKTGKTQIKVYFQNANNHDSSSDYLGFYSGESSDEKKPILTVNYKTSTPFMSFYSIPAEDGRVYDQNNGTGIGFNSTEDTSWALRLGDWSALQGFRTILSFDTSALPDDCNVVSAIVEMTCGYENGTDPFTWAGQCLVDVTTPYLGTSVSLENYDWQAPANAVGVASFSAHPGIGNKMASSPFNSNGLSNINKTGKTQIKVYFQNANNANTISDYLGFYAGESNEPAKRPKLTIYYEI